MKSLQIVAAILNLVAAAIALVRRHKAEKNQERYEKEVEQIKDDPAGYARDRFGVRDSTKADDATDTLHSDSANRPNDP